MSYKWYKWFLQTSDARNLSYGTATTSHCIMIRLRRELYKMTYPHPLYSLDSAANNFGRYVTLKMYEDERSSF